VKEHKIRVDKNLILVNRNLLAEYFGRSKNTISGWKNNKNMPVYITEEGTHYYNLLEVIEWNSQNVNERFNPNRDKEIKLKDGIEEFKLDLPYGLEIAEIDTKNSLHLSILAAHPMGELIRDTLEFKTKYDKSEFELRVKKKEFLKTEELNARMSEFLALVKDVDVNMRAKFPLEIAEDLLEIGLIKESDREMVQSIISKSIDKIQKEKYKIISKQFMKHIIGRTKKITLSFLDEMKEYIRDEVENRA